ncbi:site-specific integrase [Streptomyces sp. MP131-18]|uniref:site-specific integrase n=1 Tax=Streptomyces sp. MP131-18 TaxID=1857892 RepID=UPI00097C5A0C|nr:site-specific integrase [Streptomyces sp. MP131-18]ONK13073.1 site-specific tyrosine recombinase XerC [Streptomyces sp. MP131-18]
MKGSTYRRCFCRDPKTRKPLGSKCPKLRQKKHGSYSIRQELPPSKEGQRRSFSRSGYPTSTKAQADLDKVRALLALPSAEDNEGQTRIGDLLDSVGEKDPIPDLEETRKKFSTGQSLITHITIGEWLDEWLAGKKKLRDGAKTRYDVDVRVHLKPHLGHIRRDRLTVPHLDEMFAAIEATNEEIRDANAMRRAAIEELASIPWKGAENRARRRGLKDAIAAMPPFRRVTGMASQHRIKATLRAALNTAIKRGQLSFNAAGHVELEPAERPKALFWTAECVEEWRRTGIKPSPVMVWTPEQTGQWLDFVADHWLYGVWHVIAFRGLRRGEACGCRRQDRNRKVKTLTIAKQLVQTRTEDGWGVRESAPKTNSGARVIALDSITDEVIDDQLARQDAKRRELGEAWQDTGRLFTTEDGSWIDPRWLSAEFDRLVEASGLPPIRLHDLRHGAASLMLAAGVDAKIVAETLGHSDTRVTREVYQHVLPQVALKAAEATARMIPRGEAAKPAPSLSAIDPDRLLNSPAFAARLATLDLRAETFVEQLADAIRTAVQDAPELSGSTSSPAEIQRGAAAAEAAVRLVPLRRTDILEEEHEGDAPPENTSAHATLTPEGAKIIPFPSGRVRA